jgi:Aspartyl protease
MTKNIITLVVLLFTGTFTFAQQKKTFLKANSVKISIKDGNEGITRFWNHLKKNNFPIIYHLAKNQPKRQVTFYTDIDSIRLEVLPNSVYHLTVVLNKKDTCFVLLSTVTPEYVKKNNKNENADTIPFAINKSKQIIVKASINNSEEIDCVFDLGARYLALIGKDLDKINHLIIDGHIEDESVSGLSTEATSSRNILSIGKMKFIDMPICFINEAGFLGNGGGLIGFNVFQGKVLEIDFDSQQLLIHNKRPEKVKDYTQIPFKQTTGGMYIPITLDNGTKKCTGWYFFDTGADFDLSIDSKFGVKENLFNTMLKIGTVGVASTGNKVLQVDKLQAPFIKIGNYQLNNVPVLLGKESYAESAVEDGVIGIGLQKRFNMIIDYPNSIIYLKPNKYYTESFKKKNNYKLLISFLVAAFILFIVFLVAKKYKLR